MSHATLSVQISLGLHIGGFVALAAICGVTSSLPQYQIRQGGPIVLAGAFTDGMREDDRIYFVTPAPVPAHVESQAAGVQELAPAATNILPTRAAPKTSLVHLTLPPESEGAYVAPEHEIQTPTRSPGEAPQDASVAAPASPLQRRELSAPSSSVSTAVSLPAASGSGSGDVDEQPRKLATNPPPPYPADAFARGQQGRLLLEVKVTAAGTVEVLRVVESSGVASLDESALDTVARWRFEPALRGGRAVSATVNVPIRFSIRS